MREFPAIWHRILKLRVIANLEYRVSIASLAVGGADYDQLTGCGTIIDGTLYVQGVVIRRHE